MTQTEATAANAPTATGAPTAATTVHEVRAGTIRSVADTLAVEAPLQIQLRTGTDRNAAPRGLSITMRTPGHDTELAAGFLFTEGLVRARRDIASIEQTAPDTVVVTLAPDIPEPPDSVQRGFAMTSSCGLCGKTSLDGVRVNAPGALTPGSPMVSAAVIHGLPGLLRMEQASFSTTGGIHAAGLFDVAGRPLLVREDIGRHNAVDKIIGARFLADALPALSAIMVVSGRAGFELVQKALIAQVPIFAAVGAPTSLSAALATEAGMTLLGFVRDDRFNIYCGEERIRTR